SSSKGVRRHGVDPNRSRNEGDMRSLSSPRQLSLSPPVRRWQRPPRLQTAPPAPHLGRSPGPVPNEPPLDGEPPLTQRRAAVAGSPEISIEADGAAQTSSFDFSFVSPPNRSSKASEVQRSAGGTFKGIHHRATLNLHASKSATSAPSNRSSGRHTWGRSPGPVPNEPPLDGEPPLTQRRRCRGRSRPEISIEADGAAQTSSFDFSFVSPPNRSSKASEVQPISRRNLQRVVKVHRIHHRATLNLHASKSVGWKFLRSFTGKNFGTG
ncbi:hypothetical protein Prudu_012212, partial [Prunus dulcis]